MSISWDGLSIKAMTQKANDWWTGLTTKAASTVDYWPGLPSATESSGKATGAGKTVYWIVGIAAVIGIFLIFRRK